MRILFLCNKSPWPAREGGPMAMNMLISGLTEAGHQVKVLAVNSYKYNISLSSIPYSYREQTGIELIDVDLRLKPFDALVNLLKDKSYHVQRFISDSFRKQIITALLGEKYDIVQLETLFMCPYISTIRKYSKAWIVLRAHNIEHLIWQRVSEEAKNPLKKWYISHLARTLKDYEHRVIFELDGILAITPTDADYFRSLALEQSQKKLKDQNSKIKTTTQKHKTQKSDIENTIQNSKLSGTKSKIKNSPVIADLPFGLDPLKYRDDTTPTEFPSLFSLGSMNWIPNQEGIRWFLDKVWPDVHKQFPELKYYLAGREMPGWMRSLDLPTVAVLGEVEDACTFLASKAIMIVPLFSGSGIRVKIIEGMAAGKTIISTTIGAEGINYINRENILIADAPCEFFEMISMCVMEPEICFKIGKRARALIESEYDSKNLIQKLVGFYQQLGG